MQNYASEAPLEDDSLPVGTILMQGEKIFRVQYPTSGNKDLGKILKLIGDFAIDILATDGVNYLINVNGKLRIDKMDFTSSLQSFKNYIRPCYFKGSADDLESLVAMMAEKIILSGEKKLIVIKNFVGFYEHPELSFWIFQDRILITHKNKTKLKQNQEVLLGTQEVLKIEDFWISIDQTGLNKSLIPVFVSPDGYTKEQFLTEWLAQVKNKMLLYSLLGWIISSFFLDKVNQLRKVRDFPFYVVTAGTEVGKTALLSNCIYVCGVSYTGENYASSVTPFVEMIEFSRVSHIPIWRDEYKNEKYAKEKESWIRSVYTRSNSSRGDKDLSTRSFPTRATLLLSGEDITEDPAVARKMIKMRLTSQDKVSKDEHEQNTKNATKNFSKAFPMILNSHFDEDVFLDIFDHNKIPNDSIMKDELMCYASLGAIFGKSVAEKAIQTSIEGHALKQGELINEKNVTAEEFFSTLDAFFLERSWYESLYNAKPKVLDYFYNLKTKDTIYLKFAALHSLLGRYKAKDEYRWSRKAIGQLILETYNVKIEPRVVDDWGSSRVMIFEDVDQLTDVVGDLFQRIIMVQKKWENQQFYNSSPDQI